MGNKLLDYEENMRNLTQGHHYKNRKETCNACEFKGNNGFCQKNAAWLENYLLYKYNACPIGKWADEYSL